MKKKLESKRKKLLAAVDLLWYNIVIGEVELFDLKKNINKSIDASIKHLINDKIPPM